MIAVIQRVNSAKVSLKNNPDQLNEIKSGLVILLGVAQGDSVEDIDKLVTKIAKLRIMSDDQDKMNLSIVDMKQEILVISQFTLLADLSGGNRPSFIKAAAPEIAKDYYEKFIVNLELTGIPVKSGFFGEYMLIDMLLDGPVTIVLDSKKI